MKRKRSSRTLFFWGRKHDGEDDDDDVKKSKRRFGADPEPEAKDYSPQLELLFKKANRYKDGIELPYELLMKIFIDVVESSENPIADLYSIARVSEDWRQTIISSPRLWSRIDLSRLPITKRNLAILCKIFERNSSAINYVKELSLAGEARLKESKKEVNLISELISAPNLKILSFKDIRHQPILPQLILRSMDQCGELRDLTVARSRTMLTSPKWLIDYLMKHGRQLQLLNLAMSLTTISSQLSRAFSSEFCPNLRFLDISTCDALNTHSFDAAALAKSMPNLEVLRMANISFKRIHSPPDQYHLRKLRELSMPILMRDADRDDALFATLAFGTERMITLDLRGSTISGDALLEMPSYHIRELHIDDICPIQRSKYHEVVAKWASTLEVLSLVKINCSETLKKCIEAIRCSPIRELDLSSSDVASVDLAKFIQNAKHLNNLDLTSCRSLPRGCKGQYSRKPCDSRTQKLSSLKSKLK